MLQNDKGGVSSVSALHSAFSISLVENESGCNPKTPNDGKGMILWHPARVADRRTGERRRGERYRPTGKSRWGEFDRLLP